MKGKRQYYSLIDKVYRWDNISTSWQVVRRNKGSGGVDGISIEQFRKQELTKLGEIERLLQENRYKPDPVRRVYIEKDNGKWRPLGIPTIRDRVIQQAVRQVIEPLFEQDFYRHSYGFRRSRSAHQALATVERARKAGYEYVVDLDIQSYFDEIPHDQLMEKVRERVTDGRVLGLIQMWLKSGVMEDDQFYETEVGSPQGGVISPLLANIYLNHFDWGMLEKGFPVVRYADDAIVFCQTRKQAEKAYQVAKDILEGERQLRMHPEKTKVVHFDEGFQFLGFNFWKSYMVLPEKKMKKFQDKIRFITRRQQKRNVEQMIIRLNEIVRGFGNYYRIGNVKKKFQRLDEWTRMRVRAFMRKRKSTVSNHWILNKHLEKAGMVFLTHLLTTRS